MKRLKKLLVLFLVYNCGCFVQRYQEEKKNSSCCESENPKYFAPIPIEKFNSFQSPCVNVNIDDNTLLLKLDLGFRGDLSIIKPCLDLIHEKTFVCKQSMYGARGKEYIKNTYRVPKVKIGDVVFSPPILQEESDEFLKDAEIHQGELGLSPREEEGRLGWEIFSNTNLLIDVQNSQIACCDSLEALAKAGYAVEGFAKVPLYLDRGLLEIDIETRAGLIRCVLDTGTTWNIVNTLIEEQESADANSWELDNLLEYHSCKIGEIDFGLISFHRFPIRLPIQVEAILGIEFFKNHLVFLNFSEETAYFCRTQVADYYLK